MSWDYIFKAKLKQVEDLARDRDDFNNAHGWEVLTDYLIEQKIILTPEQTMAVAKILDKHIISLITS